MGVTPRFDSIPYHVLVFDCNDNCGSDTYCAGILVPNSKYACSCQLGYASPNFNGVNCTSNYCQVGNGGCNQICTDTGPATVTCGCLPDYVMATDNKTCNYNLCLSSNGGCSQICVFSEPSSRTCLCKSGFSVSTTNSSDCITAKNGSVMMGSLVGGILGSVLLISIAFIAYSHVKHKREANMPYDFSAVIGETVIDLELGDRVKAPKEIKREDIALFEEIGRGNFGYVSRCILSQPSLGTEVELAAKILQSLSSDDTHIIKERFRVEAALMAQFEHVNVVRMYGVVTIGEPLILLIELCENGSLDSYLQRADVATPLPLMLHIATDCARGMKYLASLHFIHRDLAARNILLKADLTAKISDFGMSRRPVDKTYYVSKGGQLPIRWTAPEALESQKFSEQSDAWSFGVLMYEIWTHATLPYLGKSNQRVWIDVIAGYRLPLPPGCPFEVHGIMLSCWRTEPSNRPKFTSICAQLEGLSESILTASTKPIIYVQADLKPATISAGHCELCEHCNPRIAERHQEPVYRPTPDTTRDSSVSTSDDRSGREDVPLLGSPFNVSHVPLIHNRAQDYVRNSQEEITIWTMQINKYHSRQTNQSDTSFSLQHMSEGKESRRRQPSA